MKKKRIVLCLCSAALAVPFAYGLVSRHVLADSKDAPDSDAQATIAIDEAHFPDAKFRKFVKDYDTNRDGSLSSKEIENVYDIDCHAMGIKSLKGVEYFSNLNYLDCDENELTELNVSKLQKLTTLYCGGNKFEKLDFSKNPNLMFITCWGTIEFTMDKAEAKGTLTSIDISACRDLSELNVEGNQLTELDISNNPNLTRLYCPANKITSLDVSHLSSLYELSVDYNQIPSIDVSNSPQLQGLTCAHNPISSLDISNNKRLERIYCEATGITSLDLSEHYHLTNVCVRGTKLSLLDISETRLADIFDPSKVTENEGWEGQEPFYEFYYLSEDMEPVYYSANYNKSTTLKCEKKEKIVCQINAKNFPDANFRRFVTRYDLNGDKALSVSEIAMVSEIYLTPEYCNTVESCKGIEYFTSLYTLDIENMKIEELILGDKPELAYLGITAPSDEDTGEPHSYLKNVDISGCANLSYFISFNNAIKSIDLSHNPKLESLSLYGADLTSLDISANTKLTYLEISGNWKLKSIDLSKCPQLESLQCGWTGIKSLDLSKLPNLKLLNCYASAITELDVSKNPKLNNLGCGYNKIQSLDLSHNPELDYLECSFCTDASLKNIDLSKNTKLKEIAVYGNSLTKLDVSNCKDLEVLRAYYNQITKLDLSKNSKLLILDAASNQIKELDVSNCKKLQELIISDNPITKLDISKNRELANLECSATKIGQLDLSKVNLTKLDISMTGLKGLDLSKQTNLEELFMYSMDLEQIDLSKNTELRWLELEDNLLSKLDLKKQTNLQYLDIRFNMFTEIPENSCSGEVYAQPQKAVAVPENFHLESRTKTMVTLAWNEAEGLAVPDVYEVYRSEKEDGNYKLVGKSAMPKFEDAGTDVNKTYYYYVIAVRDLSEYGLGFYGENSQTIEVKAGAHAGDPSDDPTFEDFVERLYTVALDRESDPEGKAFWVKQVVEEGKTGADCARFFLLDADEFMKRNLSVDDFVETLYATFFDRESDEGGKKGWVDAISSGAKTRAEVVNDFIESTEWCDVCATYGVKSGAQYHKATKASKNAINFATRLYTCCLKRDAEDGGLKYWSLALTNLEKTGAEAAQFFFESEEFAGFNTSDKEYLLRLYTTFMDREPAESEIEYWIGEIAGGRQTRHSILAFFAQSPEFTSICKKYGIDRGTIA